MANVPQHIAIILDGNGRWAKAKGMPRTYGHTMGAKNVEPICRAANALGVKYLTKTHNMVADDVAVIADLTTDLYKRLKESEPKISDDDIDDMIANI